MVTPDIAVAYTECKLKSYLLLYSDEQGPPHEYISVEAEETEKNREIYLFGIKRNIPEAEPYSPVKIEKGTTVLLEANLIFRNLSAYADSLTKVEVASFQRKNHYVPTLVVGTHKISKKQKFQLAFIGYVLSNLQRNKPASGTIVVSGGKAHTIKLATVYKDVDMALKKIKMWTQSIKPESPPIILNKQCSLCPFQKKCEIKAVEKDDLSLLSRLSPKEIQKYHKKGIFTVNQLSYLFRPRKQRKRKKSLKAPVHYRAELQALAIRTKKIYIKDLPELCKHAVELFLDIEGTPDQDSYYLIGLLVVSGEQQFSYSFWADSINEEQQIWDSFIEKTNEYPNAPIYHYGSYDAKAIHQLKNRYGKHTEAVDERLVNVISLIYGKIYFPVRSNSLKDIGVFLGMSWSHPKSSGLQSLVWRYSWNESKNQQYKKILITYNQEDCKALYQLTSEILLIIETADSKSDVDFVDRPKKHATDIGNEIHEELDLLLKFAHIRYNENKIHLNSKKNTKSPKENLQQSQLSKYVRIIPKPMKEICVSRMRNCPTCHRLLKVLEQQASTVITDLIFTKNGCRKTIIKYFGKKCYCLSCRKILAPKRVSSFKGKMFGHSFIAWIVYQRIILRLPYEMICQALADTFNESASTDTIVRSITYFAEQYSDTEAILLQKILKSSFVHVDETTININGAVQYIWVFTDGKHVVFRLTETRQSTIVHEYFSNYSGVLISDFYAGYDAVNCRQQKCWAHLMRDLNDDLWKEPFNEELEVFVLRVKDLILPIFKATRKYGLKKRHLNKFRKSIEVFYKKNIDDKIYKFEVTTKYQKRFIRYRNSLFTFIEEDGIDWHNNMAERAIKPVIIQRKISMSLWKSGTETYLLLLSIAQSCKLQNKSFLKFLVSQEKEVDEFKSPKQHKYSRLLPQKPASTDSGNKTT